VNIFLCEVLMWMCVFLGSLSKLLNCVDHLHHVLILHALVYLE